MSIRENLEQIYSTLPSHIKLVAVSKYKTNEAILEAYEAGQRIFGENKVQELKQKFDELPKDIEWHFIGHLQTNKVKYIAPFVSLIHSVDSFKILSAIDKEGAKNNRTIGCLLQFHIATEETKFGLSLQEAHEILQSEDFAKMEHISIVGVMGMATFTEDQECVNEEFQHLKSIFEELKKTHFEAKPEFREISMGMSDDYQLAIEQGSTMVRIGSNLFGTRQYV
jgi:PLP dependent protein